MKKKVSQLHLILPNINNAKILNNSTALEILRTKRQIRQAVIKLVMTETPHQLNLMMMRTNQRKDILENLLELKPILKKRLKT